jgi:hypothetical protein
VYTKNGIRYKMKTFYKIIKALLALILIPNYAMATVDIYTTINNQSSVPVKLTEGTICGTPYVGRWDQTAIYGSTHYVSIQPGQSYMFHASDKNVGHLEDLMQINLFIPNLSYDDPEKPFMHAYRFINMMYDNPSLYGAIIGITPDQLSTCSSIIPGPAAKGRFDWDAYISLEGTNKNYYITFTINDNSTSVIQSSQKYNLQLSKYDLIFMN